MKPPPLCPGDRFGRLVVISEASRNPRRPGHRLWLCRCDCGQERTVEAECLKRRGWRSCGCFARENIAALGRQKRTHGRRNTPEYAAWCQMRRRCQDPTGKSYQNYGGRGIRVCEEWSQSFEAFFACLGPRPSDKHSLDRIDNDGDYEPGNCRWATSKEQSRNQRTNHPLTHEGRTQPLSAWAEEKGMKIHTLLRRIRAGWPVDVALTTPVAPSTRQATAVLRSER